MRLTNHFHINSFALNFAFVFVFVFLFFKERPGRAKETVPFTKADRLGAGKN